MLTLQYLNDTTNDAESTQNSMITLIIISSNSELIGKLINRIQSSGLLISSLPGLARRTYVNHSASIATQQALSKPCLVNSISKDTYLVF